MTVFPTYTWETKTLSKNNIFTRWHNQVVNGACWNDFLFPLKWSQVERINEREVVTSIVTFSDLGNNGRVKGCNHSNHYRNVMSWHWRDPHQDGVFSNPTSLGMCRVGVWGDGQQFKSRSFCYQNNSLANMSNVHQILAFGLSAACMWNI